MQSIQRSRELLVQERTALSNHLRGLLLEFGGSDTAGFCLTNTTHTGDTGGW
jgi:transposase